MDPIDEAEPGLVELRRLRAELRDSMGALEQALSGAAPRDNAAWSERVHVALVELAADVRDHIALTEGGDGLHQDVVANSPRLAGEVERLARDHVALTGQVADLLERTDAAADRDVDAVRAAGLALLGRLVRHRQRGADLVYEAYQSDLGGEN